MYLSAFQWCPDLEFPTFRSSEQWRELVWNMGSCVTTVHSLTRSSWCVSFLLCSPANLCLSSCTEMADKWFPHVSTKIYGYLGGSDSRGESWEDCEWRLRIGHCCQPFSDIQPGALLPGGRKLLLFPFHRGRGRGPEQVWDLPEVTQYKVAESEIGLGSLEALQVLDAKSSSLSHSPMVSDSPAGWGRPEGRQEAPIWVAGEGEERGLVSSSGSGVLHTTEGIKIKAQIRIKLRLWPELPSFLGPGWNKDSEHPNPRGRKDPGAGPWACWHNAIQRGLWLNSVPPQCWLPVSHLCPSGAATFTSEVHEQYVLQGNPTQLFHSIDPTIQIYTPKINK